MGQGEILECLEKHKQPISRKQIAEETEYDVVKVSHLLRKLLDKNEIKCIELNRIQAGKMLGMSSPFRRTRFYYL